MRALLFALALLAVVFGQPAQADEAIHRFDADIDVHTDGDIAVTETISVTPEYVQVRHGIYRALPKYYVAGVGERFRYRYEIQSVQRNGEDVPFKRTSGGNAMIIRIGDARTLLPLRQKQVYTLRYRVRNEVRYFGDHDELYWNVTGNYWTLPIETARAQVHLPDGAAATFVEAYTGPPGDTGADFIHTLAGKDDTFAITRALAPGEGLTIALGLPKGITDPPSLSDQRAIAWQRYGGAALLAASLLALTGFYLVSWQRVGRDSANLPVFPRYAPPADLSPAAAHYIYFRRFCGNDAIIASILDLAVKGYLNISTEKKKTTLTKRRLIDPPQLPNEENALFRALLGRGKRVSFGGGSSPIFSAAHREFRTSVKKAYGDPYFKRNAIYAALAVPASVSLIFLAMPFILNWTIWHFILIFAIAALNGAFIYLMPAATRKGQSARSEVAGFRLYLETAEKLQLNAADAPGGEVPPMSKERYETFLPYAVALNVEKPWSEYFERVLPEAANGYDPKWNRMRRPSGHSLRSVNKALTAGIGAGVASAAAQSAASSGMRRGFSSGGYSGGGGGGGGGGGW